MMKINLFNETNHTIKPFKKIINTIFKHVDESFEFNVVFVSDEKIKMLNGTYRGIDKVTDVLSFPEEEGTYIGDVFISIDQATRQSLEYNHSLDREIGFLVTHGYLHLLGYDHQTPEEEQLMREAQETLLKKAKLERI
ncbi:MAG: rRNA maturation RNase YbeY [Acholeplasmataceae bacterium]